LVNLEQYKIFIIVANEGNITKASEILHISQPAVSKHIKNLEEELQIRLFNRNNHGIDLTNEGRNIYNEVKEHIYALEKIYDKYRQFKNINMGIHATMLNKIFSTKLSKFYESNENVKVNIINNDTEEMLYKLSKKEIDIVISKKSTKKLDNIEFIKLGMLQDILITNNLSNFINKTISINELKEQIIYMPRKTSITTQNFFESLKVVEENFKNIKNISYSTMLEIIKNTNGIGLVTKEYIKNELKENQIIELRTSFKIKPIEYGIYINKGNKFKELNSLIKIIQSF